MWVVICYGWYYGCGCCFGVNYDDFFVFVVEVFWLSLWVDNGFFEGIYFFLFWGVVFFMLIVVLVYLKKVCGKSNWFVCIFMNVFESLLLVFCWLGGC